MIPVYILVALFWRPPWPRCVGQQQMLEKQVIYSSSHSCHPELDLCSYSPSLPLLSSFHNLDYHHGQHSSHTTCPFFTRCTFSVDKCISYETHYHPHHQVWNVVPVTRTKQSRSESLEEQLILGCEWPVSWWWCGTRTPMPR